MLENLTSPLVDQKSGSSIHFFKLSKQQKQEGLAKIVSANTAALFTIRVAVQPIPIFKNGTYKVFSTSSRYIGPQEGTILFSNRHPSLNCFNCFHCFISIHILNKYGLL